MTLKRGKAMTAAAVAAVTFNSSRAAIDYLLEVEQAAMALQAVTGCPSAQAHRIANRLGAGVAQALAGAVIQRGVTLEEVADAIRGDT